MRKIYLIISFILVLSLALTFNVAARPLAATAPTLGTAGSFAVLGGSTVTNTGPSIINGNLGAWPGNAIPGFPPGLVIAPYTIHAGDAVANQAQSDVTTAYNVLEDAPSDVDLTGQDLGTLTLTTGVYSFNSSAQLTGTLTLDAQGDPNAVFIFQIGSALTTASNSSVVFINSGSGCNVFWQVGSSATLGTTTSFQGSILALQSITLNTGAIIIPGRALARNGAVTLDTNTINMSICEAQPDLTATAAAATATAEAAATATAEAATATANAAATATAEAATATANAAATATAEAATATANASITPTRGPSPTNTVGPAPSKTPVGGVEKATSTLLPVITALPGTGGAPIRTDSSPWGLVVIAVFSTVLLVFGVRAYRSTRRRNQ